MTTPPRPPQAPRPRPHSEAARVRARTHTQTRRQSPARLPREAAGRRPPAAGYGRLRFLRLGLSPPAAAAALSGGSETFRQGRPFRPALASGEGLGVGLGLSPGGARQSPGWPAINSYCTHPHPHARTHAPSKQASTHALSKQAARTHAIQHLQGLLGEVARGSLIYIYIYIIKHGAPRGGSW